MAKRGRPPAAAKVVEKLEQAGMQAAADLAREAGGLPPRALTEDEDFTEAVRVQVVGPAVGFNCRDVEHALHRVALVKAMAPPKGRQYRVTRDKARIEVGIV